MNNRRKLLAALGASALAAPHISFAQQQGKVWRIGFLAHTSGPDEMVEAFREQLRTLGYIEGSNLSIEYRFGSNFDRRATGRGRPIRDARRVLPLSSALRVRFAVAIEFPS